MKRRHLFRYYTLFWVIAIIFLFYLLWTMDGNASMVNYGGIVRGATQKLVKEELYGTQDDELIAYLDAIIYDLQTGEGEFGLDYHSDNEFQSQLSELIILWDELKSNIYSYRDDSSYSEALYVLSQQHFTLADNMVAYLEDDSNAETSRFICLFCFSIIIFIAISIFIYEYDDKLLNKMISIDPLTQLSNRVGFEEATTYQLHHNPRLKYCIIKFDIDNFKLINTAYSYSYGDELLVKIASALSSRENSNFIVAHIDADNFILLCRFSDSIIHEIDGFLSNTVTGFDVSRLFNEIKFTYGAYLIEDNDESIKTVISKSIMAHKAAKDDEYTMFYWYNQELLQKIERENQYSTRIEQAISKHEFQMYLQPLIDLDTMVVVGAECLVRWQLPDDGKMIYPDSFIPLFERNGLITKLDFHMLELVCIFLSRQKERNEPYFKIAVNISRITLSNSNFLDDFVTIVDGYHIPHQYIEIEVTENSLNTLSTHVIKVLNQLRNLEFTFAMDDFGSGYSNLGSLSTLPVQILKLDKQFLSEIDKHQKMAVIINSVVNLAHSMELQVVCEGVEQASHVEFLQLIGCKYAQGYYFAKPMPSNEFIDRYGKEVALNN